jgi:SAM-dependent methyltransferase
MTADGKTHWQTLYETTTATDLSWYELVPARSLELIEATGVPQDAAILDVGGGTSTLVDHLLRAGFTDVTVLDIAAAAFAAARARLNVAATQVHWIEADVTRWQPDRQYSIWHDRALLHFLIDPAERMRYVEVLRAALAPGGHVVIATFGPEGPTRCSGLDVQRYAADDLGTVLGARFSLVRSAVQEHITPVGHAQQFSYAWWRAVR